MHHVLEVERVGDGARTNAVVLQEPFDFQRVLVYLRWRARNGQRFEVWMAVVCWLVKGGDVVVGAVVSVPESASSSSPPSSGTARNQWLVALSMRPARSKCSLAVSGRTAHVMAALRRRKAI